MLIGIYLKYSHADSVIIISIGFENLQCMILWMIKGTEVINNLTYMQLIVSFNRKQECINIILYLFTLALFRTNIYCFVLLMSYYVMLLIIAYVIYLCSYMVILHIKNNRWWTFQNVYESVCLYFTVLSATFWIVISFVIEGYISYFYILFFDIIIIWDPLLLNCSF